MTKTNDKPVAKSLHTVTVIMQVARLHMATNGIDAAAGVRGAMGTLGLANRPDPYGLAAKALTLMEQGK